ncbi:LysR family transcriptional regulator ArgP [Variovorax saccharolyticus]|uniref:LysR family transcriptional regulator ArgP n=1 Tax=Variovorax saccharolyticus TaxID=3053516 RepID=UPI00336A53C5
MTPSAVSQRIKGLEERIGRVLVQRGSPCVATPAGQALQRHAQQLQLLEADVLRPFGLGPPQRQGALPLALAVNADSLATWFVPALAAVQVSQPVAFELHVEDQDHSALLLREGRVMAAVTSEPGPVQGCVAEPLGAMRYVAVASPAFMARHFAQGVDAASLAAAPCSVFNARDSLQARFMRRLTRKKLAPPLHRVPGTHGFIHAAVHGLGWGMNPQVLVASLLASGDLVELVPGQPLDVALFWQHWRIESEALRGLTGAVHAAAGALLVPA